ncbi:MAG: DUF3179 domain-containing protein [Chloroflexi bacterium]|nr:DUF3179 domain-containing protein [Chloroflexota bacterium]
MRNQPTKFSWIVLLFALVVGLFSGSVVTVSAQLSCANPPLDVSSLTRVWDKTDFCQSQAGVFDDIISGGVPRDGIPPIDNPTFESMADAATWLQPQSPVIAFALNGTARAYPLAILTRHEIVNDVVSGVPVAVTFCPLCNSAVVLSGRWMGRSYASASPVCCATAT